MAANFRILIVDDEPQIRKFLLSLIWAGGLRGINGCQRARCNHSSRWRIVRPFALRFRDAGDEWAPVGTVGGGPPSINSHCADVRLRSRVPALRATRHGAI